MKLLQNKAARALISFFGGATCNEIRHISTGDPNRPMPGIANLITLVFAVVIYVVLSYLVKGYKKDKL